MKKGFTEILKGFMVIMDIFIWLPVDEPLIYIQSPNKKTIIRADIKTAKRIIRKHGWEYLDLQPIVSRKDALRIMLFGNKVRETRILYHSYTENSSMITGK